MQIPNATMSDADLDRLEDILSLDVFNNEAMTLDMLQGFLCAVISGPGLIPAGIWLPAALGESPSYESAAQAEEAMSLLMRFYNDIATALSQGEDFNLILYGTEEDPDELDYAPWCDGYIYGTEVGAADWFEEAGEYAEDLAEKMEIFFLLNGLLKEAALENKEPWLSEKEEERRMAAARDAFPGTVSALYRFWLAHRSPTETVRRTSPKVGRNDSCPCGSGKKFKQCCGKEPTLH